MSESTEFEYEAVDPSTLPTGRTPGPQPVNPHRAELQRISGTGKTVRFTINTPPESENRDRHIRRHVRWLRAGALETGRSVRIWHEEIGDGRVRISFQDREARTRRSRPTVNDGSAVSEAATAIAVEAANPAAPAFIST